jgi:hypothetical protein
VKAPIAAYHHVLEPGSKWGSLLIQHGSYQWIDLKSQPHIERGQVLLYRGIERASAFRYLWLEPENLSPFCLEIWRKYLTFASANAVGLGLVVQHDPRSHQTRRDFSSAGWDVAERRASEANRVGH